MFETWRLLGDQEPLRAWARKPLTGPNPLNLQFVAVAPPLAEHRLGLAERLRWLPERRLVARGDWSTESRQQQVVIKWFMGAKDARYARREAVGSDALIAAGVRSPARRATLRIVAEDGASLAHALVFDEVDARPLRDSDLRDEPQHWEALVRDLARLHAAGVLHTDLHFGNLLLGPEGLTWIDGDGVRQRAGPLSRRLSQSQFALLIAQGSRALGASFCWELWVAYCEARGWGTPPPTDQQRLWRECQAVRRARLRRLLHKVQRECSAVRSERVATGRLLLDREWLQARATAETAPDFSNWLLGAVDTLDAAPLLKQGNTATVARLQWQGTALVVKRYNNKSPLHRLRRWLREDRGLRSWRFGHGLRSLAIATARPVALLRTRRAGPSYLVAEELPGEPVTVAALGESPQRLAALGDVLLRLRAEGLIHGDLKSTNLLLADGAETPALIDLDAMSLPRAGWRRRRGFRRDRARLLANFVADPALLAELTAATAF